MVGSVDENTAIRTLFNTGWAGATAVAYENEPFTAPDNASFVRLHNVADEAQQYEFGGTKNTFRHRGLIFVMIFSPPDQGNAATLALADQAAEIFRGQSSTFTDGRILYRAPSIRTIGVTDEGYFHVNVVVPYIRDSYH